MTISHLHSVSVVVVEGDEVHVESLLLNDLLVHGDVLDCRIYTLLKEQVWVLIPRAMARLGLPLHRRRHTLVLTRPFSIFS